MASADENAQLGPKWLFVPVKARNHRREKAPRPQQFHANNATSPYCQKYCEGGLRSSVSLAERVNSVQFGKEMGCVKYEFGQADIFEISLLPQATEQPVHFSSNVLGIAERIGFFTHRDGSELTRPRINVLKQVPMDGAVVCNTKTAVGQRFVRSLSSRDGLELLQGNSIPEARQIFQNGSSRIAIGMLERAIHSRALADAPVFADNRLAPLNA
jgi:hypothetical protein